MDEETLNDKFNKPLSSFTTILGLTPNEALAVARNDGWFEINKNNDAVVRSVNYEVKNKEITQILKKNDSTYMVVDKTLNSAENLYKTPEDITGKMLASVLFSVNGNKGPFEKFKQFYKVNGVADTNEKKMFLAHLAWFHGNGGITGYRVKDDPLIQREMLLLGINKDNIQNLPDPASGNEIFNDNVYFENFKKIFDENKRMFDNFKMDLDRSTKFLETLQEQEQERKSYMNQLPQLGGKKNKKSQKTRKSQKLKKSRKSQKKQ